MPTGVPSPKPLPDIRDDVASILKNPWNPFICNRDTRLVYTEKLSTIAHMHDGEKPCVGIFPDWTLSVKIQTGLLVHRKVRDILQRLTRRWLSWIQNTRLC